jgi:two-component system, OmpR family, alkaline phosphatase synthesis response regulator PhoP
MTETMVATPTVFMKKRVLLVEDDDGSRVSLIEDLMSEGYDVRAVANSRSCYEGAAQGFADLIVLKVKDGLEVCQRLRHKGSRVPILMLTAPGQPDERVLGLQLGADDCLTKPFEPAELLARVEALLRRASGARYTDNPGTYQFGTIHIDFDRHQVLRDRTPLAMLPLEYKLLRYFVQHRSVTLPRHRLLDEVWGYDATPTTRTVDVHVAGLRQKIEPDPQHPRHLLTIHRRGYKFVG